MTDLQAKTFTLNALNDMRKAFMERLREYRQGRDVLCVYYRDPQGKEKRYVTVLNFSLAVEDETVMEMLEKCVAEHGNAHYV